MLHELTTNQFPLAAAGFRGALRDPLLYATLEGSRPDRVWVDDVERLGPAFAWTQTECAYVACDREDGSFREAVRELIVGVILPILEKAGRDYLSLFAFPNARAGQWEELMADRLPWRTPVCTFSFEQHAFMRQRDRQQELPSVGPVLRLDAQILGDPRHAYLADEISYYWGSVARFLADGCGYGIPRDGELASWCYVQARGAGSETVDIWTAEANRRQGLGTTVARAVIEDCMVRGLKPFWLCDEANETSRRLAEGLGFQCQGHLDLVDIPLDPHGFYVGLARYFFLPHQRAYEAAACFERAFLVAQGLAEDRAQAARAWALAGDGEKALHHLRRAAELSWEDASAVTMTDAFEPLWGTEAWLELLRQIAENKRNGG
jgi:RimJ/RimL family protein N-acetyltransferase